jgi:hypothetical protein
MHLFLGKSGSGWAWRTLEKVIDLIYAASMQQMPIGSTKTPDEPVDRDDDSSSGGITSGTGTTGCEDVEETTEVSHSGKLLIDATACPQDIAFPTDLMLLNTLREKSEMLIEKPYHHFEHGRKNRGRTEWRHTLDTLIWQRIKCASAGGS